MNVFDACGLLRWPRRMQATLFPVDKTMAQGLIARLGVGK
jgi:hypothetical protein